MIKYILNTKFNNKSNDKLIILLSKLLSKFCLVIIPVIIMIFNVFVIFFPKEIIKASFDGLILWFNIVLPSLLPFVICANILTNLGFVETIGILLEPIMKKVFNVSGSGAFPFISGITSGYPIGAKIIGNLREEEVISKTEAQKLLTFCNNSGPLFVIGSIGAGMFQNPKIGYFLLICHYLSAITNGIFFKFYNFSHETNTYANYNKKLRINKSLNNMKTKYKSFGDILSKSVANAMDSMLQVCGFIILFSVICEILNILNFFNYISNVIYYILQNLDTNMDINVIKGYLIGMIEMTNGASQLSKPPVSLGSLIAISFILSFGGFSIHCQSINFISKTDINILMYLLGKLSHAIFSAIWTLALFSLFNF